MQFSFQQSRFVLTRVRVVFIALVVVALVASAAIANVYAASGSSFVTRSGSTLMLNGSDFRFAGTNMYWLGLDDNIRDSNGNATYPPTAEVDNGFAAAKSMGATVVRAHSLGISVGCTNCLEPSLGVFNDAAFKSIDYAVADAGKNNVKLMIPLTDEWRYYHGGKSVFTGWEGYTNVDGATAGNNQAQKASEANFYTDPKVIAAYEAYISHLLNHVNQYTGVALKNDPTVMAWETGNEIWDAPPAWTEQIAKYIKATVGAQQLVADGSAAGGNTVNNAAIDAPDVDIVGGHFYPMDTNWMTSDAAIAAAHNKAYIVGEYDWTNLGTLPTFLSAIESNKNISGDLTWVTLPYEANGTPLPHGDSENMYVPSTNSNMASGEALLTAHAAKMGTAKPAATTTTAKPVTTTTAPKATTTTTSAPKATTTTTAAPKATTTTSAPTTTAPVVSSGSSSINDSSAGSGLNQINYSGSWTVGSGTGKYNGDDHYADSSSASYSVAFKGGSIAIYGAQAPWHGLASVSVDGGAAKTVDFYSANRADNVSLFSVNGLSSAQHTLTVKVLGQHDSNSSGNVVTVDRLVVGPVSTVPPTTATTVASASKPSTSSTSKTLNDTQLTYSGPWQTGTGSGKYDGDDHYSDNSTSSFSATFTGTHVSLYGARASWHGLAAVSIDGGPAVTIDYYSANRADNVLMFSSSALKSGSHTIKVTVLDAHDPSSSDNVVTVDRLVVS